MSNLSNSGNDNSKSPFDSIKQVDDQGNEFWMGRNLMSLLGYTKWQRFGAKDTDQVSVVEKAIISCKNAKALPEEHFVHLPKQVSGSGTQGENWKLSRYACYLIAMNGDVTKPEIAMAQSYFAIKTREAEVEDKTSNQISIAPDLVANILRDSLSRTKLLPEVQELCILRGLQEGFPQLRPHLEPGVKMLKESTASVDYHVTPTELGKIYSQKLGLDNSVSAIKINTKLLEFGFQLQEVSTDKKGKQKKTWQLTKEGKKYGVVQQDKAAGHDKIVESVRWLPEVVDEIIRLESA